MSTSLNCNLCKVCLQAVPKQQGFKVMLQCCSRPDCEKMDSRFCARCYFDKFEVFQIGTTEPHDATSYHIWLYHELHCQGPTIAEHSKEHKTACLYIYIFNYIFINTSTYLSSVSNIELRMGLTYTRQLQRDSF